jgi:hypothetical protein
MTSPHQNIFVGKHLKLNSLYMTGRKTYNEVAWASWVSEWERERNTPQAWGTGNVSHKIENSEGQFWERLRFTKNWNARKRNRKRKKGRQQILNKMIASIPCLKSAPTFLYEWNFWFVRVVSRYLNYSFKITPKSLISRCMCSATDDQCSPNTPISGIFWQFVPILLKAWSLVQGVSGSFKNDTA